MENSIPEDCLFLILEYISSPEDYVCFLTLSKTHWAVAEYHRERLKINGPRSRYIKTFAPFSIALRKASIIRHLEIDYTIEDLTPYHNAFMTLPNLRMCKPVQRIQLYGYKSTNVCLSYDNLPDESKIPGMHTLSDLTDALSDMMRKLCLTFYTITNFFEGNIWPKFVLSSCPNIERRVEDEFTMELHHAEEDIHLYHLNTFETSHTIPWESLEHSIRNPCDPRSGRSIFRPLSLKIPDDSIDPGKGTPTQ